MSIKPRADRLPAILAAHALWLDTDGQQGTRADLHRANLEFKDLGGARLQRANLRHARLGGANLRGADLREADLRGAIFEVTTLGYNELDLPREHASAVFDGALLAGVLVDGRLGDPRQAPSDAPVSDDLSNEPPCEPAAPRSELAVITPAVAPRAPAVSFEDGRAWVIRAPVSTASLEALARRLGGVLDPQLAALPELIQTNDDCSDTEGITRVWQRSAEGCSLGILYRNDEATLSDQRAMNTETWHLSATTRRGDVIMRVHSSGSAPSVVIEVTGTPEQTRAVLAEARAALGPLS